MVLPLDEILAKTNTMKSAIWGAFFHLASHIKKLPDGTVIANVDQKVGANSNKIYPIKQKPILLDLGYPEDIIKHVKPI